MKCVEIMNANVQTLSERDTVLRAATLMAEVGVGFLPICDQRNRAIGVVTDRDLVVRGLAKGVDPRTTSAAMLMTSPAITCLASADLRLAEELMERERKSRLVLTNADGTVAGILSVADLVEHAPKREALHTLQAVLLRESLGPRGGAEPGTVLLRDQSAGPPMAEADLPHSGESVFSGGHRITNGKTFPG